MDKNPGDRQEDCHGLLKPIDIESNSKKGYVIVFQCIKCGQIRKNKVARDDNKDRIYEIIKNKSKGGLS